MHYACKMLMKARNSLLIFSPLIKHLVLKSSQQRFAQQPFLSFWWTCQVKTCKSCCKPIYPFPVTTSLIEIGFHLHFLFPTGHKNNMCLFDMHVGILYPAKFPKILYEFALQYRIFSCYFMIQNSKVQLYQL